MKRESNNAQKHIEREIGSRHRLFAYPYGEYNKALKAIVKDLGYIDSTAPFHYKMYL